MIFQGDYIGLIALVSQGSLYAERKFLLAHKEHMNSAIIFVENERYQSTDCYNENKGLYFSQNTLQQQKNVTSDVHATMETMQLSIRTNVLSYCRVLQTRFMLMYAISGDL